jgi:hypothetical protein
MGLSWQQGPLASTGSNRPLSRAPTFAEGSVMRRALTSADGVRFGGTWIVDSENVLLLFEPGRYPVAYFPDTDVSPGTLERTKYATRHHEKPRPGTPSGQANTTRREAHSNTSTCPPVRANSRDG